MVGYLVVQPGSSAVGCGLGGCHKGWWGTQSPAPFFFDKAASVLQQYPPPSCISYANVHNYYGPYAYCSLDKGVACAQHIQLLTHTCAGHMC